MRLPAKRPTNKEKPTRITQVRPARTAVRRQRSGQRRGWRSEPPPGRRPAASSAIVVARRRPDDVAGPPLRVEDARLAVGLELAAHVGHEDVDRVRHRHRVVAPDLLEQALAGDHEPLVAHQVLEQLELAVGQIYGPVAAVDLSRVGVEPEIADGERGAPTRWAAAHQRTEPRQELSALERLHQVVVRPGIELADAVIELRPGRQDQDRDVALAAQAAQDLGAVELRKAEVEDDEIGDELLREGEGGDTVGGRANLVALLPEGSPQDVRDRLVVLDDEDAAGRFVACEHDLRAPPAPLHASFGAKAPHGTPNKVRARLRLQPAYLARFYGPAPAGDPRLASNHSRVMLSRGRRTAGRGSRGRTSARGGRKSAPKRGRLDDARAAIDALEQRHYDLIGLALLAAAVYLAFVLYFDWNGGRVG